MSVRKIREGSAAFTLAESVLVLAVVISLLYLPLQRWQRWQEQLTGEAFFRQFERELLSAQQGAISMGVPTEVVVYRYRPEVELRLVTPENQRYTKMFMKPASVQANKRTDLVFKGGSGNVDKITDFSFSTTYSTETVVFQVYLGSGRFVRK